MKINIDLIYPVGSIYMSVLNVNPSDLFGGEWERIAQGRCLMGEGTIQPNSDNWCGEVKAGDWTANAEATGGEVSHTLTTAQIPSHQHKNGYRWNTGSAGSGSSWAYVVMHGTKESNTDGTSDGATGGGGSHNNLPPYLVVYMWKRVS